MEPKEMSVEKPELVISIKCRDLEETFSGSADKVLRGVFEFLSRVYPAYVPVSQLVYSPDFGQLMLEYAGFLVIADKDVVVLKPDLDAENAIVIGLIGAYIGYRLKKLDKETLSNEELVRCTGKAPQTVYNAASALVGRGIIERVKAGEYKVTSARVIQFTQNILPNLKGEK